VESTAEYMFDGRIQKLTSVLAALASVKFAKLIAENVPEKAEYVPVFDCRVWQVPTKELAADAFLWRELDATKNSISMAAHAYFSHKSLQGMSGSEKQELLWSEKGINWNDFPVFFKRGTYVQRKVFEIEMTEEERMAIPEAHRPAPGDTFPRNKIVELELPPARRIANYTDVIFNVADPIQKEVKANNGNTILELS